MSIINTSGVSNLINSKLPAVTSLSSFSSFTSPGLSITPNGIPSYSQGISKLSQYGGKFNKPYTFNLQKLPTLVCDSSMNFDFHNISDHFITLGSIPAQLQTQLHNLPQILQGDLKKLSSSIKSIINNASSSFTSTMDHIKSFEHQMMYKAREFQKSIEHFFASFTLEKIVDILSKLRLPNPGDIPIPGLSGCKIKDMFTPEGRNKIKNQILALAKKKALNFLLGFLSAFDASMGYLFNGKLGDNIPEYQAEEVWHKLMSWTQAQINYFMQFLFAPALSAGVSAGWATAATAAYAASYTSLGAICTTESGVVSTSLIPYTIDPTIAMEAAMNAVFEQALSNATKNPQAEMNKVISSVLSFSIPSPLSELVGFSSIGQLIAVNLQEETFKYKMHKTEMTLAKVWDLFKHALERMKRAFTNAYHKIVLGSFDDVLNAVGRDLFNFALDQVPLLGSVWSAFDSLRSIFNGTFPACTAMVSIASSMLTLTPLVQSALNGNANYKFNFTTYGALSKSKLAQLQKLKIPF